jgi:hypothetical protein
VPNLNVRPRATVPGAPTKSAAAGSRRPTRTRVPARTSVRNSGVLSATCARVRRGVYVVINVTARMPWGNCNNRYMNEYAE